MVTLTEQGVLQLRRTEDAILLPTQYQRKLNDKDLTLPLWELMQIFGPQMYNGNPRQMFVDNEVRVIEGKS